MNWAFHLSDEERHLAKVGDLDALERGILEPREELAIAGDYERIFEALSGRAQTDTDILLDWGQRYLAWANRFTERDGLPFLGTEWARRCFEIALSIDRANLAREIADAILRSYAPLEKERRWWQKQHYALTSKD